MNAKQSSKKHSLDQKIEVKKEEKLVWKKDQEKADHEQEQPPQITDEKSIAGHMPDPAVDDNALEAAQKSGLYTQASEEEPVKVGIAEQVEKAEQERRDKK